MSPCEVLAIELPIAGSPLGREILQSRIISSPAYLRSGNLHGMFCVRTSQITAKGDNKVAQLMRAFEVWLVWIYRRMRVQPQAHQLASMADSFVRRVPGVIDRRNTPSSWQSRHARR
mmetsp:Transcript_79211/g.157503  ORF Transcript_79211/g.157503 Transcript_79211/m.157503 type:complete len:117 (-) Transcript_79211:128-478(-)